MEKEDRKTGNDSKIILLIPVVLLIVFALVWLYCYYFGILSFDKNNTVSILSSIIQGMSALMSVFIAVAIFRIQSLENRIQSLEQTTLNYIFQITTFTYPQWLPSLEQGIRNGAITKQYFDRRVELQRAGLLPYTIQQLEEDRNDQQERLIYNLKIRTNLHQAIRKMKTGVLGSTIYLIIPIAYSFLLLMITNTLTSELNFIFVSIMVYFSVIGIVLVIFVVFLSMVQQPDS
jgi:hypothetical protein